MLSSDNELTRISEATEASTSTTASAMLSTGALSADFSGERTQSNMSERMVYSIAVITLIFCSFKDVVSNWKYKRIRILICLSQPYTLDIHNGTDTC
jgi:hypothetical protein